MTTSRTKLFGMNGDGAASGARFAPTTINRRATVGAPLNARTGEDRGTAHAGFVSFGGLVPLSRPGALNVLDKPVAVFQRSEDR